jgi:hypothetical protein
VFRVGTTHTVGIVQIGSQITVSGDGHWLTQFTDTQRPYLGGDVGLYTEDSEARFSHLEIASLPAQPAIAPGAANPRNSPGSPSPNPHP